MLFIW